LDRVDVLEKYPDNSSNRIPCISDDEIMEKGIQQLKSEGSFCFMQFHDLNECHQQMLSGEATEDKLKEVLKTIDARIKSIHEALPHNCLFIVYTGNGNMPLVQKMRKEGDEQRLMEIVESTRNGLSFFGIKKKTD